MLRPGLVAQAALGVLTIACLTAEARFFNAPADVLPVLRDELRPGDHVLIKASRAVALETVVEALVAP